MPLLDLFLSNGQRGKAAPQKGSGTRYPACRFESGLLNLFSGKIELADLIDMKFKTSYPYIIVIPESDKDKEEFEALKRSSYAYECSELEDGSYRIMMVQRWVSRGDWMLDD